MKVRVLAMVLLLLAVVAGFGATDQAPLTLDEPVAVGARLELQRFALHKKRYFRQSTNLRVCHRVPQGVPSLQRSCQPRRSCSQYWMGNLLVRRCQSVGQWLTKQVGRSVMRRHGMCRGSGLFIDMLHHDRSGPGKIPGLFLLAIRGGMDTRGPARGGFI